MKFNVKYIETSQRKIIYQIEALSKEDAVEAVKNKLESGDILEKECIISDDYNYEQDNFKAMEIEDKLFNLI
jgi:hypothetical protein